MLKDLIANATVLISFLFIGGEITKYANQRQINKQMIKVYSGILTSILGIILMIYSVSASSDVIIDLRHFAIIIAAINQGIVPTIIAGILMSIFRVIYFGYSYGSIIGAVLILTISVFCVLISRMKIRETIKWILMNIISILSFSYVIITTIKEDNDIANTLIYFTVISCIVGVIVFYLSKHIVLTNTLYLKYKKESMKDFLTGLNNVRNFDLSINSIISNADSENTKISFLMLDIDHFKRINDTYGHLVGDQVLKELAVVITNCCRSTDNVSRVGGEEFCVILSNCNMEMALEIAENIRITVEKNPFTMKKIAMTISIGVACYPDTIDTVDLIRKEADKALYYSKQNGRNQVNINSICN